MYQRIRYDLNQELIKISESGLYKEERVILTDQKPEIKVESINEDFCSSHPLLVWCLVN